jgi:uncharacterized protein (DUF1697 family)
MYTYIALFRGINVGGKNTLPMKELAAIFERLGASHARTYIRSGNVVFKSASKEISSFSSKIGIALKEQYGFEPRILVIEPFDLETAINNNPFPEAESDPSSLHLGFLAFAPENPKLEKLESLKKDSERFCLIGNIFYLHAPEGIGRSKLAASSEKLLGVPMSDRNWNTVCKLQEMAAQL